MVVPSHLCVLGDGRTKGIRCIKSNIFLLDLVLSFHVTVQLRGKERRLKDASLRLIRCITGYLCMHIRSHGFGLCVLPRVIFGFGAS